MVTCYPRRYLDEYDIIDNSYFTNSNPKAKQERDAFARVLRKEGWKVTTKKWNFYDMGSGTTYTLFAERLKQQTQVGEQPATAGV